MNILKNDILSCKLLDVLNGNLTFSALSEWATTIEAEDWHYGNTDLEKHLIGDILFALIESDVEEFRPSEDKIHYFIKCLNGQKSYSPEYAASLDTTSSVS